MALASLVLVATACGMPSTTGHREWSCAAYCMKDWHCVENGDSTWDSTLVTSTGDSAADAFKALSAQCKDPEIDVVSHFQCVSGTAKADGATIASSCAPD